MEFEAALPALLITAMACLGFLKRPQSLYELLAPRFVVPGVLWISTVGNLWLRREWKLEVVERSYEANCVEALWFFALCYAVFWLAYALPLGSAIGKQAPYMPLDLRSHSSLFLVLCLFLLVVTHVGQLAPPLPYIDWILVILMRIGPMGGALLLGLYLGARPKLGPVHIVLMLVVLSAATWPLMARFSRGSGLPIVITAVSFFYMRQKVRLAPLIVAVLLMAYLGVQGLNGRSVKGHSAGALSYLEYLSESPLPDSGFDKIGQLVHDALTPTTVAIQARRQPSPLTRTLPVKAWLLNAIPVPRAFGLPPYTLTLGSYISGQRIDWGFTPSIFGDLVHHLGWAGSALFLVCGFYFRALESVGFRKHDAVRFSSEWYSFLVLLSYYALVLGIYLNYRAWLSMTMVGVYGMIAFCFFKLLFFGVSQRPPDARAYFRVAGAPTPGYHDGR